MINIDNLKIELPLGTKKKQSVKVSINTQKDGAMVVKILHRGKTITVENVSEYELADGLLQIVKELSVCSK